eukprot:m.107345 g.107345  ORF g.107345 m.107345 type:complete len:408 (-) comp22573_c1_seq1:43-1266(-)
MKCVIAVATLSCALLLAILFVFELPTYRSYGRLPITRHWEKSRQGSSAVYPASTNVDMKSQEPQVAVRRQPEPLPSENLSFCTPRSYSQFELCPNQTLTSAHLRTIVLVGEPKSGTTFVEMAVKQLMTLHCNSQPEGQCRTLKPKRRVYRSRYGSCQNGGVNFLEFCGNTNKHIIPILSNSEDPDPQFFLFANMLGDNADHQRRAFSKTPFDHCFQSPETFDIASCWSPDWELLDSRSNYVLIVRHPLEVIVSAYYYFPNAMAMGSVQEHAKQVARAVAIWTRYRYDFFTKLYPSYGHACFTVFYEDITVHPAKELEKLGRFLNMSSTVNDPALLHKLVEGTSKTTMIQMQTNGLIPTNKKSNAKVRSSNKDPICDEIGINLAKSLMEDMRPFLSDELWARYGRIEC